MSYVSRFAWVFLGLWLLGLAPAYGQEMKPPEKPWTGKLADGRVITTKDLDKILQEGSDLCRANLSRALMKGAKLINFDLRLADLSGANLSGANLFGANLSRVQLLATNLSGANLTDANLSGALSLAANLTGAKLVNANLSEAQLFVAILTDVLFEPKPGSLPGVFGLIGIIGLDSLKFEGNSSFGLMELREIFKKAGMRDDERQVTYALNHTRRVNGWENKQKEDLVPREMRCSACSSAA